MSLLMAQNHPPCAVSPSRYEIALLVQNRPPDLLLRLKKEGLCANWEGEKVAPT